MVSKESSNRTFMELKYGRERGVAKGTDSSNRTFMELKYRTYKDNAMTQMF